METTKVYYYSDGMYSREIERKSVKCPFCGVINIPEYLFLKNVERSDFFNVFTQCTNPTCRNMFITQFSTVGVRKPVFTKILPTALPEKRTFSNIISELSPNFCEIYNQAYIAEQTNLMQICGTGYRKSLEFLIKDKGKGTTLTAYNKKVEIANSSGKKYIEEFYNNPGKLHRLEVHLNNDEVKEYLNRTKQELSFYSLIDNRFLYDLFDQTLNSLIRFEYKGIKLDWDDLLLGVITTTPEKDSVLKLTSSKRTKKVA